MGLFTRALDAPNVGDDAVVLVHPTCGPTQEDDIPGEVRHKTYEVLIEETKDTASGKRTRWAYLPYSMHMAGPREAIQHMMIRKNFGCTHFIVGRDMAGSKSSVTGGDFYGAYDAQDIAKANADELGVQAVPSLNLVCNQDRVRHRRRGQGKGHGDQETFGHQVPPDAARRRGHPGVVCLQVRRKSCVPSGSRLALHLPLWLDAHSESESPSITDVNEGVLSARYVRGVTQGLELVFSSSRYG